MQSYVMFGSYSANSVKEINEKRTKKAVEVIEKLGGTVERMYALLGEHDIVLIITLPNVEKAMTASIALTRLTGISFSTAPAIPVEKFDRIMEKA